MKTTRRAHPTSWTFYAMLVILLLGSYLRIHDLNAQGLWGDEGWSIWLARGDTPRDLVMTMVNDHHGAAYSFMLRGWEKIFGPSVVMLRYLTVTCSILSLALIYPIGRRLFTPAAGVWAALAFALMDKHIVLTQEVRHYPISFFLMMATVYFYIRWWQGPSTGSALGYVAFSLLGLYTHYYCFFANIAVGLHALFTLRQRDRWRHFMQINALMALGFVEWFFVAINQYLSTPVNENVLNEVGMPVNRETIRYLATESFGSPVAIYGLLMVMGIGAALLHRTPGPMSAVPRPRRLSGVLLVTLWFLGPIVLTFGMSWRYPLLTDRNIAFILPAIALLVGHGLTAFDRFSQAWIVSLVVIVGLTTTSSYYVKPPWRAMARDIAARRPAGEPVLIDVEGEHAALWYHLKLELPESDADQIISLLDYRERFKYDFLPMLKTVLDQNTGLWLSYWGEEWKKHDVFDLLAAEGFVRTATLTYTHHGYPIYAYRYDRAAALVDTLAYFGQPDTGISLRKIDYPAQVRSGQTLPVLLWWQTGSPLPVDYTVSVFLLDESGVLRAQHDSYPADGTAPTTTWTPDCFVFDAHGVPIPSDLPPGQYTVGVKLYTWWDGVVLPADGSADFYIAGSLTVK